MYVCTYVQYVPSLVCVLEYAYIYIYILYICVFLSICMWVCGCECVYTHTFRNHLYQELTVFDLSKSTNGMFAMMRSCCSCRNFLNGVKSPGLTPCGVVCGECP